MSHDTRSHTRERADVELVFLANPTTPLSAHAISQKSGVDLANVRNILRVLMNEGLVFRLPSGRPFNSMYLMAAEWQIHRNAINN